MDNHTKEVRSYNMSRIRNKNSKPEMIVRKFLFSKGLRYRKNVNTLPGKPDIVLPKYRCVIFVNGCFWHGHFGCSRFKMPKSNTEYWNAKIKSNVERDNRVQKELFDMGWKVMTVWECQLKRDIRYRTLNYLYYNILRNIKD